MALTTSQNWTILRLTYWHLERDRLPEAESLARGLLSLDKRNGEAWYYYGEARRRQDDDAEAARAFRQAVNLLEDRADIGLRLGETLLRLRRFDDAQQALDSARHQADDDAVTRRIEALLAQCSRR